MGLIDRFRELLAGGGSDDGTSPVVVANVRMFQAPMLEQVLAEADIAYSVEDNFVAATAEDMRMFKVPRAQAERAEQALAEFHQR